MRMFFLYYINLRKVTMHIFNNNLVIYRRQTAEERELERQAANRLLLSFHPESVHRKSMVMSADRLCLSHLQRIQEKRAHDV